jgi:hypothetical protein
MLVKTSSATFYRLFNPSPEADGLSLGGTAKGPSQDELRADRKQLRMVLASAIRNGKPTERIQKQLADVEAKITANN